MSTCISTHGEYGDHEPEGDTFTCVRCGAEDWAEAMAHIARLAERLDLAVTMHGVQYERANRVTAENDRMAGALADLSYALAEAERDYERATELADERFAAANVLHAKWQDSEQDRDALAEAVQTLETKLARSVSWSEVIRALRAADVPEDSMAADDDLSRYEGHAEAVAIMRDMLGV